MPKKGQKQTKRGKQAGAKNLAQYRETDPAPALKHGAYSQHMKRKYTDGRYKEAKQWKAIEGGFADDMGGAENLNQGQLMLLGSIRSNFIVVHRISEYVQSLGKVVDENGEVLPCLKSFGTYTENLRRNIESFYGLRDKKKGKSPDLEEYLKSKYGENNA